MFSGGRACSQTEENDYKVMLRRPVLGRRPKQAAVLLGRRACVGSLNAVSRVVYGLPQSAGRCLLLLVRPLPVAGGRRFRGLAEGLIRDARRPRGAFENLVSGVRCESTSAWSSDES